MFTVNGITYSTIVTEQYETRVAVANVSDMQHVTIPADVHYADFDWTVVAVADTAFVTAPSLISVSLPATLTNISSNVFAANLRLSAIDWQSDAPLSLSGVANPNLLVYVNDPSLAPQNVRNVVVGEEAEEIVLSDSRETLGGFHPLRPFTARSIRYSHNYMLETPLHGCEGWETLSLPFDVETIEHETKGSLAPFAKDENGVQFWDFDINDVYDKTAYGYYGFRIAYTTGGYSGQVANLYTWPYAYLEKK
jgi:hypothetical protein